ncbi:MAG: hypothetical protein ABEH88_01610 [Halobacteriales archaeon]|jgi:hypothetical protein
MTIRARVLRIATAASFVGLVVMSLALEAYKPPIDTNTELYLGFFALGGVSLILGWFAFADIRR